MTLASAVAAFVADMTTLTSDLAAVNAATILTVGVPAAKLSADFAQAQTDWAAVLAALPSPTALAAAAAKVKTDVDTLTTDAAALAGLV